MQAFFSRLLDVIESLPAESKAIILVVFMAFVLIGPMLVGLLRAIELQEKIAIQTSNGKDGGGLQ